MHDIKRRDGFEGEKLISLPDSVWMSAIRANPILSQLYITHIGYFPNALHHFCERRNGCADNILIYCIRGKGWYTIKNRRFEVGVNEFIIIPATAYALSYGADEDDPWTIYWVHFSGKDMRVFNKSFGINIFDGPQQIFGNDKGLRLWDTMHDCLEMGYSKENLSNANLCLYNFVATFLFPDKHLDTKKQDAKTLIDETILFMKKELGNKLSLEEISYRHNLSVSHFSALFRKSTGMSPLDYFIHLKLQKACLLLFSADMRIKTIADELGYNDPYYFSRLFKKHMNHSPDQYRQLRRRNQNLK